MVSEKKRRNSSGNWRKAGPNSSIQTLLLSIVFIALVCLAFIVPVHTTDKVSESSLRFSSVLANAPEGEYDYIEIENLSDSDVSLDGHYLMLASDPQKLQLLNGLTISAGSTLKLTRDGGDSPESLTFSLPSAGGETVALYNPSGRILDEVILTETKRGEILQRTDTGDWDVCDFIDYEPSALTAPEITEIVAASTLYEDGCDYIELHNPTDTPIDLTGWMLSDNADKPDRWIFPTVVLQPDEYLVVRCCGEGAVGTNAGIGLNGEGETIYLSDPEGKAAASLTYPALSKDEAWSLFNGVWGTQLSPTPGLANSYANAAASASALCTGPVIISEITASPADENRDWIELYNTSDSSVDLSGYGLSDNSGAPRRWRFPEGSTIGAKARLIVICCGDDTELEGYINTDFNLSKDGCYTVTLAASDGTVLDAAYVPEQRTGVSYGRITGQDGFFYLSTPTPGAANDSEYYRGIAHEPVIGTTGGTFTDGDTFTVALSAETGAKIRYTTDSSTPTENSTEYTGPITVSGTTILRVRAFCEDCMPSATVAQSYLFDVNNPSDIYVISIVSDPDGLFSEKNGILVKGPSSASKENYYQNWEREAFLEIYDSGNQAISQRIGIKTHGHTSQELAIIGLKLIARTKYGDNRLRYPLFSASDYTDYQSVVLRASGQDLNKTYMRDVVFTDMSKDTSLLKMEWEPAIVYLNGEYYGFMYLRSRINKFSICQYEGWEGMEDDIDIVSADSTVIQGSNDDYSELVKWVKTHDMSTQEAYDYVDARIDIQSYIEFMAVEIFVGNGDMGNQKRYRNPVLGTKWRWVLFDLDWGLQTDTNSIHRWFDSSGFGTAKAFDTSMFRGLMSNPTFKDRFLTYFGQQLATNWSTANVLSIIESHYELIKPYLSQLLKRIDRTEDDYNSELRDLVSAAKSRPMKIYGYFDALFKFSDEEKQKYFGDAIAAAESYNATKS